MNEDIKDIFSSNLNRLMEQRGLTVSELSDKTNIAYSTVNDWKNGKKMPRGGNLQLLSDFFNVNLSDLTSNKERLNSSNMVQVVETIDIPIIGKIACGEPITAIENITGYMPYPKELLPKGEIYYLRAEGHSMEPKIPSGSLVMCRKQEDIESGEIAAVLVNGDEETTLKRVRKVNDMIILEPLNDDYEPYIVTQKNPARIIGKALQVLSQL